MHVIRHRQPDIVFFIVQVLSAGIPEEVLAADKKWQPSKKG